jgi:hypothetical protein
MTGCGFHRKYRKNGEKASHVCPLLRTNVGIAGQFEERRRVAEAKGVGSVLPAAPLRVVWSGRDRRCQVFCQRNPARSQPRCERDFVPRPKAPFPLSPTIPDKTAHLVCPAESEASAIIFFPTRTGSDSISQRTSGLDINFPLESHATMDARSKRNLPRAFRQTYSEASSKGNPLGCRFAYTPAVSLPGPHDWSS